MILVLNGDGRVERIDLPVPVQVEPVTGLQITGADASVQVEVGRAHDDVLVPLIGAGNEEFKANLAGAGQAREQDRGLPADARGKISTVSRSWQLIVELGVALKDRGRD